MKEKIKKIFYFAIKVLFVLSIFGFLFLILSDKSYGGGAVMFILAIWGLFEYAKWVNKKFNIGLIEEESLGDKLKKELGELTPEEAEKLSDFFSSYYKRKVMESVEKDENVRKRIHEFAELVRKKEEKYKTK